MDQRRDGMYWIRLTEDSEPEVARLSGGLWYLIGHPGGVEPAIIYSAGPRAEPEPDCFRDAAIGRGGSTR